MISFINVLTIFISKNNYQENESYTIDRPKEKLFLVVFLVTFLQNRNILFPTTALFSPSSFVLM